jgi:hypothetical protein
MQWSPGLLTSLASFTLLSACARPIVDEQFLDAGDAGVDTGAPDVDEPAPDDPDTGDETPEAGEGSSDAGGQEAGCSDRDHDTVCDAQDNCPDTANTNQADANEDGVGDACSQAADSGAVGACKPDMLPASVKAGDVTVSDVRVNGASASATVKKGQRVSIAMHYEYDSCSVIMTGQLRSMVVGYEGQSTGTCGVIPEALICPQPASGNTTLMVDAPNRSGLAYVMLVGHHSYNCSESLSGAQKVAALCVE